MEREYITKIECQFKLGLPEIVRCKDCRFRDDAVARASVTQWMPCEECRPYDEWYCAYGERKGGDSDG